MQGEMIPSVRPHRSIWVLGWASALVLVSSWSWAGFAFFYDPVDPQTFHGWPWHNPAEVWLQKAGIHAFLHTPWFQSFWFVFCWATGVLGAWLGFHYYLQQKAGTSRKTRHFLWIGGIGLLALLPQWFVPPLWSSDVYLYSLYGRISQEHRRNPLVESGQMRKTVCLKPSQIPAIVQPGRSCHSHQMCPVGTRCMLDPYVTRTPWSYQPSAYGPLAVILFHLLHHAKDSPQTNARKIRLMMGLCLLGLGLLLFMLGGSAGAVLCLWFPLSWLESANGGHLESLQMGCLLSALLGLRFHQIAWLRSGLWIGLWIGLAALIKITMVIFLFPLALFFWKQRDYTRICLFLFAALTTVAVGYAGMWGEPHPFVGLLMESQKTVHSLMHLLRVSLHLTTDYDPFFLLRIIGASVFAVVMVILFRQTWRKTKEHRQSPISASVGKNPSISCIVRDMGEIWLVLTLFVLGAFHPWHSLVGLTLVALLPYKHPIQRAWLWIAATSPLFYYGSAILSHHRAFSWLWLLTVPALIFGVPLGIWLWYRCSSQKQQSCVC